MKHIVYRWKSPITCAHRYLFPAVSKIIEELGIKKDSYVLDAGCGGGAFVNYLYKRGFGKIYGVDASPEGIEVARINFPEIEEKFFIHDCYDECLPFNQRFNLIISMEVIEHLYSPKKYLENIYNWLAQDGFFVVSTPYHGYFKNLAIILFNRFDKHFDPLSEGGHIKFFSRKTISMLLHNTGFTIMGYSGCGRIPFLWKSMIIIGKKVNLNSLNSR